MRLDVDDLPEYVFDEVPVLRAFTKAERKTIARLCADLDLPLHQMPSPLLRVLEVVHVNRLIKYAREQPNFETDGKATVAACHRVGIEPKTYTVRYRRWLERADD